MKAQTFQQEILLMTNTAFFQREWCKKDDVHAADACYTEQLEEVRWNILLDKMLPEITGRLMPDKLLNLWQINPSESFLQIQLCEFPLTLANEFSIDTYNFLPALIYS